MLPATDYTGPALSETPSSENDTPHKPPRSTELFVGGTRRSKIARQEELRFQAVRSIAESMKPKSEILEERNAIEVFSRPEAVGLSETVDFWQQ